ncbi:MAG: dihydropteroate synthase [Terriglobia bacterium]
MRGRPQFTLAVRGRKILLGRRTLLMGVLNVTPDSFSDGGRYLEPSRAIHHAFEMVRQGADWIDIGGESTRPGAHGVSVEEELRRVLPVVKEIHRELPALPLSIDTTRAEVAEAALRAGASIVNDVSGLRFDARIAAVVRRHRVPLILMHIRGRPESMQQPPFARSIRRSINDGLSASINRALHFGVRRSQLIIDPGLGFGKTRRQNFEILARLERLRRFRLPILIGASRKSFVQAIAAGDGLKPSGSKPILPAPRRSKCAREEALTTLDFADAGTAAAAVLAGAHMLRVHRVEAVLPAVRIADAILIAQRSSAAHEE